MRIDPYAREPSPFDHEAFYERGEPYHGPYADEDTGLRCVCGREVVNIHDDETSKSGTGWAHVGIGNWDDLAGLEEWHQSQRNI